MMLALAVPPVPASVEEIAPVVLFFAPAVVPVTLTENEQEALVAIVPPERLTAPEPAVATIVPEPQEPVRPLGVETIKPEGRVSLKATPVIPEVVFGLVIVKVRLVEPLRGMLAAPKAFAIVGVPMTVSEALEVLPVPPFVELTVTLLFLTPVVVP